MRVDPAALARLPAEARAEAEGLLAELGALYERNPLWRFEAHSSQQDEFLAAVTPVQAAFAGNRFGKTTALVVKCFVQHTPNELLPERLRRYKVATSEVVSGRLMCPSNKVLEGVNLPALRKWAPREILLGGEFDKAWDKQHRVLRFADGGRLEVFTYEMDADKLVGASCDYVAYDEPPSEGHRNENLMRLVDREGFEMFALTPVNMTGGGIGWLYRKVWKQREAPWVTVVKGSIHDNPTLSAETIEYTLAQFPEEERQAREHGDFVHFGGMIYPGGFEGCLIDSPSPKGLEGHDVVVGIDPGLRVAAFVWVCFDRDNRAFGVDEAYVLEGTPLDYVRRIREVNSKWGFGGPLYVIDPSARNRSLTNAESVEAELQRQGIFPMHGQNSVLGGVQQLRRRMQEGSFFVSRECRRLRGEAEEYRQQDRPDGEFQAVKENDHGLDALRYAVMSRPWYPVLAADEPKRRLGFVPDFEPAYRPGTEHESCPMGMYT